MSQLGDKVEENGVLPLEIFRHVLSFMDTKYSAQTSVLSKHYKSCWAETSALNFNSRSFKNSFSFSSFVCHVLRLRFKNVRNISFINHFTNYPCNELVDRIIKYAIRRGIKEVRLDISSNYTGIVQVEASEVLQIRERYWYTGLLIFPRLKSLTLEGVEFWEKEVFTTCPNLHSLSIKNSTFRNGLEELSISAPNLVRLTITLDVKFNAKIVLSVPKLISFSFKATNPPVISTSDLIDVQFVSVDVGGLPIHNFTDVQKKQVRLDVMNMLTCLRYAKYVTLSAGAIQVLSHFTALPEWESSPFEHLTELRLRFGWERNKSPAIPLHVLAFFHRRSPCSDMIIEFDRCNNCIRRPLSRVDAILNLC